MPNNDGPKFKTGSKVEFEFEWRKDDQGVNVAAHTLGQVVERSSAMDADKTQEYYWYDVELETEKGQLTGTIIYGVEEEHLIARKSTS